MTRARFTSLTGSSFHVFLDDGRVAELTLMKVTDPVSIASAMPDSPGKAAKLARMRAGYPPADQCFILQFSCGNTVFPQDTYVVDHGTLGSFSLFLVPGGVEGDRTCSTYFDYAPEQAGVVSKAPIVTSGPIRSQLP